MDTLITLPLRKEVHEDYLRYVFKSRKSVPVQLNRDEDLGRYITSRIRYSDTPVRADIPSGHEPVDLLLPKSTLSTAANRFVFFTAEDVQMINDYISADFSIFFRQFMSSGQHMGIEQKDLIEAFLVGCRIRLDGRKFEMLKKKDYRFRMKIHDFVAESMKAIGY